MGGHVLGTRLFEQTEAHVVSLGILIGLFLCNRYETGTGIRLATLSMRNARAIIFG